MKISIGIPNPVPGTEGNVIVGWARRAEAAGFASLATIDRVAYPSYDSLVTLAAAASVTERIGLVTNILLEPTRNPVLLAKGAASVDQLSGGRFILGLGVGGRRDDFDATGQDFSTRGARFDRDLEIMHRAWTGEPVAGSTRPVGPAPSNGERVPILIGGMSDRAIERTLRWGIGWTVGGAPPEQGGPFAERVRTAWREAGRDGEPRLVALTYFGLREDAGERAAAYLGDYYGDFGAQIARYVPTTADQVRERVAKFADFGFDELFLDPTTNDLDEIERLAAVVL